MQQIAKALLCFEVPFGSRQRGSARFGVECSVNSHLVILDVRLVGAYASMCELHPLVGKRVRYGCAFDCSYRFAKAKGVGFYFFPAFPEDIRQKGSRQLREISGLLQNINGEYAVVALLQVSHSSSACSVYMSYNSTTVIDQLVDCCALLLGSLVSPVSP